MIHAKLGLVDNYMFTNSGVAKEWYDGAIIPLLLSKYSPHYSSKQCSKMYKVELDHIFQNYKEVWLQETN